MPAPSHLRPGPASHTDRITWPPPPTSGSSASSSLCRPVRACTSPADRGSRGAGSHRGLGVTGSRELSQPGCRGAASPRPSLPRVHPPSCAHGSSLGSQRSTDTGQSGDLEPVSCGGRLPSSPSLGLRPLQFYHPGHAHLPCPLRHLFVHLSAGLFPTPTPSQGQQGSPGLTVVSLSCSSSLTFSSRRLFSAAAGSPLDSPGPASSSRLGPLFFCLAAVHSSRGDDLRHSSSGSGGPS